MKSPPYKIIPGILTAGLVLLLTVPVSRGQHEFAQDDISRSLFMSPGLPTNKGGWRPIISSGYNLQGAFSSQHQAQKSYSNPGTIEAKVLSTPHIVGLAPLGGEYFGSGLHSTSNKPLITRDLNKLTTIAQTYKPVYQQSSLNLNAPISSYVNPFSFPTAPGFTHYKSFQSPAFGQFDSNLFVRHPQQNIAHRPNYNKLQGQMVLGKRLKHNQLHAQMLQQLASNQYHQMPLQQFQSSPKKPVDNYLRPTDGYIRPVDDLLKPGVNYHKHVNPQESLSTQTKTKTQASQAVAPVTYKPPLGSHFQQFGLKEESFGPIPSSILGSFSSFGHASVKARDPVPYNGSKNRYLPSSTTKAPSQVTENYAQVPTSNSNIKLPAPEPKPSSSINQYSSSVNHNEDYSKNLLPPPKASQYQISTHFKDHVIKNFTKDSRQPSQGNFFPSPLDPLSKHRNTDTSKIQISKLKTETFIYNTNLPTRKPEISSFFDTTQTSAVTDDPFEPHSTNAVPDNLLVQLPVPYTTITSYNGQAVKIENTNNKDKYTAFTSINHPSKYNTYDDVKFFPPRDFYDSKHKYTTFDHGSKEKVPHRGTYEVTENWGSSGETNTQPTLHTWVNPSQAFRQYNTVLRPGLSSINVVPTSDNRVIPQPYFPPSSSPQEKKKPISDDVSTVYSTIVENNKQNDYITQLENTLSSIQDIDTQKIKKPIADETYDLATPVNYSYENKDQPLSTQAYEEPSVPNTHPPRDPNSRRKPSRYRPQETSTASQVEEEKEVTTRYETYKEQSYEAENDLQVSELPTIPPSKHFRRPVSSTASGSDSWDDEIPKKRNKLRRRRPNKTSSTSSTTEEYLQEPESITEPPLRSSRYRTTPVYESEETTKPPRPKLRLPSIHKSRPTKPAVQSEFTSSAQPTLLPTLPVTNRQKHPSRTRLTTPALLDLDDLLETTTEEAHKVAPSNDVQSSIMKIAKENRVPATKVQSTDFENFSETPDYSHKQDEKDTPTSDISINTSVKYSSQKLRDGTINNKETSSSEILSFNDDKINVSQEVKTEPTAPTFFEDSDNNIQTSQSTRHEQLFTELKSGNRGVTKSRDQNDKATVETATTIANDEGVTTSPPGVSKSHRLKIKPNKYDSNRPRFSVKDYRNRLNQYSSSTTDKPQAQYTTSEAAPRLRFPNRARFPNFKDQSNDNKASGSEINTTTELPRKKFTPKDPRHRDITDKERNEKNGRLKTSTMAPELAENELVTKSIHRLRGPRPNRLRSSLSLSTTTDTPAETLEKSPPKVTLKRPNLSPLKKRLPSKNKTAETTEQTVLPELTSESIEVTSESMEVNETTTEKHTSETAIMKIAKDERKHVPVEENTENISLDQSQRVSDLTLASSKEYNTPGLFKSVSPNSRRVPNYFTIATDDPILPIEAFFPQLNQKKDS